MVRLWVSVAAAARRLAAGRHRDRLDDELREEVEGHLALRRQALIADGMDPREAGDEARRMFGNVTMIRERTRAMWGYPSIDTILQDLRYGWRVLTRSRGVTAVAVLSLASGIGASSVLFSFTNALLFRALPGTNAAELVQVFTSDADGPRYGASSYADYEDVRDHAAVFSGLLAYRRTKAMLSDAGQPAMVPGALVSANYFDVLGVQPSRGRFFLAAENRTPEMDPVAVISHDCWTRRFGSDPQIVGRTIGINGRGFIVIGVGPPGFAGISFDEGAELFVPAVMERTVSPGVSTLGNRHARMFRVLGRLNADVALPGADAALRLLAAQLLLQYPDAWRDTAGHGRRFTVLPEIESRFAGAEPGVLWWLFSGAMAGAVMLLGVTCVNVATLLLARAAARRKEIAIRLALGASRRRVVRQLLTESSLLAAAGGVLGLGLAHWAATTFAAWRPAEVPAFDLSLDPRILLFTIAASSLTILFAGLAPALQATRPDVNAELKDHASPFRIRRLRIDLRDALVIVQVALSLICIVGAVLLWRSVRAGHAEDPGFRTSGILNIGIDLETTGAGADRRARYYHDAVDAVAGLPGVERASLAALVPLDGSNRTTGIEVRDHGSTMRASIDINVVGAGYFALMDIGVVRGREILPSDRRGAPPVVVVNETMARQFWGGDALGKLLTSDPGRVVFQVVGVVRDVRHRSFAESPLPMVFLAAEQSDQTRMTLHVRTSAPPRSLAASAQRVLRQIDPAAGLIRVETMTEYMDWVTLPQQIGGASAALAGALELGLTAMALYGVIAYTTSQRTREIGLRLALGATPASVARLIMRDGLVLAIIGIALGGLAALIAAPVVASLLIGVHPADPVSFGAAALLLLAVASAASYLPARRALRADPCVALRSE